MGPVWIKDEIRNVTNSFMPPDIFGPVDLSYPVSGPNGSGKIYVTGVKAAGAWDYSRMERVVDGSAESIDLRHSP